MIDSNSIVGGRRIIHVGQHQANRGGGEGFGDFKLIPNVVGTVE